MECCGLKSESASIRLEGDRLYRRGALWQCPIESEGTHPIEAGEEYRPDDERGLYGSGLVDF
jgi:hypothetical protein